MTDQLSFRFKDPSIKGQQVWGTLERNKTILAMHQEQKSIKEISEKFGISTTRVNQIIKHYGRGAL